MLTEAQRARWLSLTTEDVLEPDLIICDAHHHLWDYPHNRYLFNEASKDFAGGHYVAKTVYVECHQHYRHSGDKDFLPVGETEHIHKITASSHCESMRCNMAAGIVSFANLCLGQSVKPILESHIKTSSRFKGIRYAVACHNSDQIRDSHTNPPPKLLSNDKFLEGFSELEKLDLTFDAWLYHTQLDELVLLAREFPTTKIVLNHLGCPLGIGPYKNSRSDVFADWKSKISALARCENIYVKLGGLNMSMAGFDWQKRPSPPDSKELTGAIEPYFDKCVDLFGASRCMLESNFPVDRVAGNYTVLWNAFKRATEKYSQSERESLFYKTAVEFYGLTN